MQRHTLLNGDGDPIPRPECATLALPRDERRRRASHLHINQSLRAERLHQLHATRHRTARSHSLPALRAHLWQHAQGLGPNPQRAVS
ncbi:hypothetical protein AXK12_05885 [Cephaloticoccus capnophilus]|uniref:Uncharacterized protein n=1 Tax=Cephaloticoccus capnophilus TaxID=1548208 RepID=A0A139SKZ9_9BACT|nr:hypothetical protein AXK12_05885 [Cephaloticoccus capnophilus]